MDCFSWLDVGHCKRLSFKICSLLHLLILYCLSFNIKIRKSIIMLNYDFKKLCNKKKRFFILYSHQFSELIYGKLYIYGELYIPIRSTNFLRNCNEEKQSIGKKIISWKTYMVLKRRNGLSELLFQCFWVIFFVTRFIIKNWIKYTGHSVQTCHGCLINQFYRSSVLWYTISAAHERVRLWGSNTRYTWYHVTL